MCVLIYFYFLFGFVITIWDTKNALIFYSIVSERKVNLIVTLESQKQKILNSYRKRQEKQSNNFREN